MCIYKQVDSLSPSALCEEHFSLISPSACDLLAYYLTPHITFIEARSVLGLTHAPNEISIFWDRIFENGTCVDTEILGALRAAAQQAELAVVPGSVLQVGLPSRVRK